jgi:glycosyltransferase involved in cell wall biosynthesis
MRVAQITPYYPPHIGGVEIHVKELSERLFERGYQVKVVSSCGNGKNSVEVITVPSINFPYSPIPLTFPRLEADVYHSHVPSPTFAFKVKDKHPHIVTYHNDVVVPSKVNGFPIPSFVAASIEMINEKLVKPVLEKAELIIATTGSYAETSKVLKEYLHKVEVVPNAVDASLFQPVDQKEPYVIYVGRLVEYKGLGMLIEAMRDVQAREELNLVVVGDGDDRNRFKMMAAKYGVNARFTGRVGLDELRNLISHAEILVLPSFTRLEAFGIVLLEAMACKTPVLAFDTPGVNEVAKNGGFVFSTIPELVQLILELHSDEGLRKTLGEQGRKAVEEKYSWDMVVDKIEALYDEVV